VRGKGRALVEIRVDRRQQVGLREHLPSLIEHENGGDLWDMDELVAQPRG